MRDVTGSPGCRRGRPLNVLSVQRSGTSVSPELRQEFNLCRTIRIEPVSELRQEFNLCQRSTTREDPERRPVVTGAPER